MRQMSTTRPEQARSAASAARGPARCPGFLELAAYLDRNVAGGCGPGLRDAVEEHLARCPDCRQAVMDLRRILAEPDLPFRPDWAGEAAAACAAGLRGAGTTHSAGRNAGREETGRDGPLSPKASRQAAPATAMS